MTAPEVTVVIPTRDRSSLLLRALNTALAQEDIDLEVIVVDDGSCDDTPHLLATLCDDRVRVIQSVKSTGPAAARNRGINAAKGRWIAFLDDDDLWSPLKLRKQLAAAAMSRADLVWCACVLLSPCDEQLQIMPAAEPTVTGPRSSVHPF